MPEKASRTLLLAFLLGNLLALGGAEEGQVIRVGNMALQRQVHWLTWQAHSDGWQGSDTKFSKDTLTA